MAWLMKHDSALATHTETRQCAQAFFNQEPLPSSAPVGLRTREDEALAFLDPKASPVWQALNNGCKMLASNDEDHFWGSLWSYMGGRSSRLVFKL
eukprot:4616464-Alexandrium_andersonii.AAC.1